MSIHLNIHLTHKHIHTHTCIGAAMRCSSASTCCGTRSPGSRWPTTTTHYISISIYLSISLSLSRSLSLSLSRAPSRSLSLSIYFCLSPPSHSLSARLPLQAHAPPQPPVIEHPDTGLPTWFCNIHSHSAMLRDERDGVLPETTGASRVLCMM